MCDRNLEKAKAAISKYQGRIDGLREEMEKALAERQKIADDVESDRAKLRENEMFQEVDTSRSVSNIRCGCVLFTSLIHTVPESVYLYSLCCETAQSGRKRTYQPGENRCQRAKGTRQR